MVPRFQQFLSSVFLILIIFFGVLCNARPWHSSSSSSNLFRFDDSDLQQLSNFEPNPGYLSRTYLFNWIPDSSEESLTPTKRNIAIGRGDGFRPGK